MANSFTRYYNRSDGLVCSVRLATTTRTPLVIRIAMVQEEALHHVAMATGIEVSSLRDKAKHLAETEGFNFIEALLWIKFRVTNGYCPVCFEHSIWEKCDERSDT